MRAKFLFNFAPKYSGAPMYGGSVSFQVNFSQCFSIIKFFGISIV